MPGQKVYPATACIYKVEYRVEIEALPITTKRQHEARPPCHFRAALAPQHCVAQRGPGSATCSEITLTDGMAQVAPSGSSSVHWHIPETMLDRTAQLP